MKDKVKSRETTAGDEESTIDIATGHFLAAQHSFLMVADPDCLVEDAIARRVQ